MIGNLFYRILSVNEDDGSFVVRYWSLERPERSLNSSKREEDDKDIPDRCITDYNLTVPSYDMTDAELHNFIVEMAPIEWLSRQADIADPNVNTSMEFVRKLVNVDSIGGVAAKVPPIDKQASFNKEIDITDEL